MKAQNPKNWLLNVIKIRKKLINENKSLTNTAKNWLIIQNLEIWLNAYPFANESQIVKFIQRNQVDIKYLIPTNNALPSQISSLNNFLFI